MGCPRSPFFFPVQDTDPACKTDSDCDADEKCCFFGRDLRCKKGLITTPKPGTIHRCNAIAPLLSYVIFNNVGISAPAGGYDPQ